MFQNFHSSDLLLPVMLYMMFTLERVHTRLREIVRILGGPESEKFYEYHQNAKDLHQLLKDRLPMARQWKKLYAEIRLSRNLLDALFDEQMRKRSKSGDKGDDP